MLTQEITKAIIKSSDKFLLTHGDRCFDKFASEQLSTIDLNQIDVKNLCPSGLLVDNKIHQHFSNLEFSFLPITIARGKKCILDLYFWTNQTTNIHDHHFSGAFLCLAGKNIDFEFMFEVDKKISRTCHLGKLYPKSVSEIGQGKIQRIRPRRKYIHYNTHPEKLTINLCLRTVDFPGEYLWCYIYPGIAYQFNTMELHSITKLLRLWTIKKTLGMSLKKFLQTEGNHFTNQQLIMLVADGRFFKEIGNEKDLATFSNFVDYKIGRKYGFGLKDVQEKHQRFLSRMNLLSNIS